MGPSGVFRDLGRMAIYFQGAGEHYFFSGSWGALVTILGELGSLAKKQNNNEKNSASGGLSCQF